MIFDFYIRVFLNAWFAVPLMIWQAGRKTMIRQHQVYMGSVCCLACFKLDQDEAFISGVMLSLGDKIKCVQCGSGKCARVDNHIAGCGDE